MQEVVGSNPVGSIDRVSESKIQLVNSGIKAFSFFTIFTGNHNMVTDGNLFGNRHTRIIMQGRWELLA